MATPTRAETSSHDWASGLPSLSAAANSPPADQRVKELEESLAEYKKLLLDARLRLAAIHGSHWWKVLQYYYGLRHRVFPDGSRSGRLWNGLIQTLVRSAKRLRRVGRRGCLSKQYARWIRNHEPSGSELETQRQTTFAHMPRISVIVPMCDTPPKCLRAMIE